MTDAGNTAIKLDYHGLRSLVVTPKTYAMDPWRAAITQDTNTKHRRQEPRQKF